jgi:aerobic-type carbon monoxide dehydrogenase small subunit (CoxS/CutS family)
MSNLCRCGTYARIRAAIHDIAGTSPEVAKV